MLTHLKTLISSLTASMGISRLYDAVWLLLQGALGVVVNAQLEQGFKGQKKSLTKSQTDQMSLESSSSSPATKKQPESSSAVSPVIKDSPSSTDHVKGTLKRTVLFPSTLQIEPLGSKFGGFPVACATDANFNLIPVKTTNGGIVGWDFSTADVHATSWDEDAINNNFSFEVPHNNSSKEDNAQLFFNTSVRGPHFQTVNSLQHAHAAHAQPGVPVNPHGHHNLNFGHNAAQQQQQSLFPLPLEIDTLDFYHDLPHSNSGSTNAHANAKAGSIPLDNCLQDNFPTPYTVTQARHGVRSDSMSSSYTGASSELQYTPESTSNNHNIRRHQNHPDQESYALTFDNINLFGGAGSTMDGPHGPPQHPPSTAFSFHHELTSNPSDGSSDEAEFSNINPLTDGHVRTLHMPSQLQHQQHQHQEHKQLQHHIQATAAADHDVWNMNVPLQQRSPYESLNSVGSISTSDTAHHSLSPSSNISATSYSKSPESGEVEKVQLLRQSMDIHDKKPRKKRKAPKRSITKVTPSEFVCPDCGAMFKIKGYLTRHMKKHAKNKAYNCPFYNPASETPCHPSGGFSRRDTYKTHLKARHFRYPPKTKCQDRSTVPGFCQGCGEEFSNNETWVEQHIQRGACEGIIRMPFIKEDHSDLDPYEHEFPDEEDLNLVDLADLENSPVYHTSMNLHASLNPAAVMI